MSVVFRIKPQGLLDGTTVPVITTAVQDPLTGIYDVSFNSLNDNFGVLNIQDLMEVALGNHQDDFLVPQIILTDGPGTTVLELSQIAYDVPAAGPESGINRALLWDYLTAGPSTPNPVIGPKPFLNYTGQRLILQSDNAIPNEGEIYLVVYAVSAQDLLDAICCTTEGGGGGVPAASCCAPQYLQRTEWAAYGYAYDSTTPEALDLDASLCGQDGPITATIRASAFFPAGTPPTVLTAEVDPVLNVARVTWDDSGEDGHFVLEITNACGCCYLFPIEGVSG